MIATLILASACFTPALAQTMVPSERVASQADCQLNFKAADRNGNGTLSKAEISASKKVIPGALTAMDSVSRSQFMFECEGKINKMG
jgi:hypothetical protein